ncbi:hypothetical protein T4E_7495 [Trichinella pseudospiralis]|uniref:Uncharacterized protein n=1 Tax=Trichinella pseudospiralis TaxID=6337 RepID=A0A0V0Y9J3_TRIPS|nr:hypothetical protein T4E_7495 [Trichinella pseudospiralis]
MATDGRRCELVASFSHELLNCTQVLAHGWAFVRERPTCTLLLTAVVVAAAAAAASAASLFGLSPDLLLFLYWLLSRPLSTAPSTTILTFS